MLILTLQVIIAMLTLLVCIKLTKTQEIGELHMNVKFKQIQDLVAELDDKDDIIVDVLGVLHETITELTAALDDIVTDGQFDEVIEKLTASVDKLDNVCGDACAPVDTPVPPIDDPVPPIDDPVPPVDDPVPPVDDTPVS